MKINDIKANHIPCNGNCKKVRDITNDIKYGSMTEAAKANSVSIQAISTAIKNGTPCNGILFMLESELHKNTDKLCAQAAKANKAHAKANEQLALQEVEMAEFRKWKAEREAEAKRQEELRKAEERKAEELRKAKEKHEAKIAKAKEKTDRLALKLANYTAKVNSVAAELMAAEMELEELMDQEV